MKRSEWEIRLNQILGFDIRDERMRACHFRSMERACRDVKNMPRGLERIVRFMVAQAEYFKEELERR